MDIVVCVTGSVGASAAAATRTTATVEAEAGAPASAATAQGSAGDHPADGHPAAGEAAQQGPATTPGQLNPCFLQNFNTRTERQ